MTNCIVCAAPSVELVLDLGLLALANKFLTPEEGSQNEPQLPLRLGQCHDCGHVQLMETVPPAIMFEDYLYISSLSDTLVGHLNDLADTVTAMKELSVGDLVVDIGCNDGTLLAGFLRHGVRVLGVDPARNLAPMAAAKGIAVETTFFGTDVGRNIRAVHGPARAITMTNAFPHIPDLADLLGGVAALMADDGVFVIEAHYLLDMLEQGAFDTIYHEHVSYWALGPAIRLFAAHGLEVVKVKRLPIHHGQLRMFVQHKGRGTADSSVAAVLEGEKRAGLPGSAPLHAFAERTERIRNDLAAFLAKAKTEGRSVAAYGAPAKGNTLLGYLGLGPENLAWIADKSPLKQGRLTPGTHIPVVSPERILTDMPDYLLLLAWNFADEILDQQAEYRRRGGKFVVPLPKIEIV